LSTVIEAGHHGSGREAHAWLKQRAFPRVLIDDRQDSEGPTGLKSVRDEVHRPSLICSCCGLGHHTDAGGPVAPFAAGYA
jgi:hypothetical protein